MRTLTCFFLFAAIACIFSCTKIDSTTLGGSLVPDVDGVNTFDTTLDVITETFPLADDTLKLSYTDEMAVGHINDPLFGQSDATMFFELKPTTFPASSIAINARDSSVGFDSTVLCLRYLGGFGDTTLPITFDVFAIKSSAIPDTLRRDTIYPIRKSFATEGGPIGTKMISLSSLSRDSVSVIRGSSVNYKTLRELRIPLSTGVITNGKTWYQYLQDSSFLSGDSSFRMKFAGFAVRIRQGGNPGSMAYFSLTDTATKLQFFYRRKNGLATNVIDTTSTNFYFSTALSGYANNVTWDKAIGREAANHFGSRPSGDSIIYVKTNPGTEVRIRIPGLQNVSNRIIHRAELKVSQIPDNSIIDGLLALPPAMYLERVDTANRNPQKFLTIPFDLNPSESYGTCFPTTNGISYTYFGSYPLTETLTGSAVKVYNFNISRYVQQIVTHQIANYPLRLSANLYAQYDGCSLVTPFRVTGNSINLGRAKLGGGGLRGTLAPYKMRLRIIYSRI